MKKSSIITLVFAILLIVVGLALSVTGAYFAVPHHAVYNYGHGYFSYSMRYVIASPNSGTVLSSFGHLAFNAGLVLMVIFAVLQVSDHKDEKKLDEKEKKADAADLKKAKAEAVDVEAHEADKE